MANSVPSTFRGVSLLEMAQRDQTLVRSLYQALTQLLDAVTDTSSDDARKWSDVVHWAEPHALEALSDQVLEIGRAASAQGYNQARARAMHDVRGGALSTLLGRLQLVDCLPRDEKGLEIVFTLARDHLKIMRNAIMGLDEIGPGRQSPARQR